MINSMIPLSQLAGYARRYKSAAVDVLVNIGLLAIVITWIGNRWLSLAAILFVGFLVFWYRMIQESQTDQVDTTMKQVDDLIDLCKGAQSRFERLELIHKERGELVARAHREIELLTVKLDDQTQLSKIRTLIGTKHPRKN